MGKHPEFSVLLQWSIHELNDKIFFKDDFIEGDDITNKRNLYVLHGGLDHGWAGYSQERERVLAVSDRRVYFPRRYPKGKDGSSILTINFA